MKKIISFTALSLIVIYALLLIPNSDTIQIQTEGNSIPFVWDQDERWNALEEQFIKVKSDTMLNADEEASVRISVLEQIIDDLQNNSFFPDDERLDVFLNLFFETAPFIAAQEIQDPAFFEIYNRSRRVLKEHQLIGISIT